MTQTLDISGGVSEEQYRTVLEKLLDAFEMWRQDNHWCTDLYLTVSSLTRSFHWDPDASGWYSGYDGHMEVIPAYHTDESRGMDLRDIRGRILKYANDRTDVFSLQKANEFLSYAGLPPYVPETPKQNQFYVDLTGILVTELTEEQLREKFGKWMRRNGFTQSSARQYYENQTPYQVIRVPESELAELVPGVGRPTARP